MPGVDDLAVGRAVRHHTAAAHQEPGHLVNRALGGGQSDSRYLSLCQGAQTLDGQAKVRASLVPGHRVKLVQDERAHAGQPLSAALGRQQYVQRLRRRYQYVGRPLGHGPPLTLRRVAGPDRHPDLFQRQAFPLGKAADPRQRCSQVALDVVGEGLKGGYVDDPGLVGQAAVHAVSDQPIQARQEGREGLPRPGGSGDERVASPGDGRPAQLLRLGWRLELASKPGLDQRMESR